MFQCGLLRVALSLLVSLTLTSAATTTNVNVTSPIVDLRYAQYQGSFDSQTNSTSFLSIRYAAPPLGTPTTAARVWRTVSNTDPNMCYQTDDGTNLTASVSPYGYYKRQSTTPAASEDCLFLNVFIPGTVPTTPVTVGGLPVVVWIHGGGYVSGYAAEYNGMDILADSLNSVIVVIIQYRLGAFGFLAGNEVKAHGALNAGLLDQNLALQWVQEHIGSFGGDKAHVTIWGESAGAGSVLQHIVANGGNTQPPLFNAAITSSMFLPSQYYYNDRVPESLYDGIVSMTGCASSADTFSCLQSVEAETLQAANYNLAASAFYGTYAFVPVVDGTFIQERPTVILAKGQINGQALLSVSNQYEGNIFVEANETLSVTDYISRLFPDMTFDQVQEATRVYQDYGTAIEQAILVMGDSIFVCPTYYLLQTFAGRSWKGIFAIPPAYHGDDTVYYFSSPSAPPPYDNVQFITAFSQSFLSLAMYYDVNTKFDPTNITPYWDKYNVGETEMLFNRTEAGVPVVMPFMTDPKLLQRCAFWSTVTSSTAQ